MMKLLVEMAGTKYKTFKLNIRLSNKGYLKRGPFFLRVLLPPSAKNDFYC